MVPVVTRNELKITKVEVKATNHFVAAAAAKPENAGIQLYTITNNKGASLLVSNFGGAVIALNVPDKSGALRDVVLGYENMEDYFSDDFYLGTIVGRHANRISGDTVTIDGISYKLHSKDGNYHLHGGENGFNKKFYQARSFKNDISSGIIFSYTSPHLEEGFPGALQLEIIYTFDDENTWTVEYKAVSDQTTLINLTQHAYFNLGGDPAKKIDEHELKLAAAYFLPVNEWQVPTGELKPVTDSVFDFTTFKKIGRDIEKEDLQLQLSNGYDHSFVLETKHTTELKPAAVVVDKTSGIQLEVLTTEPAVHFYTGNFLRELKGKNGVVYNQRSGFCLETQHFPDAPRHGHFPSTRLEAGENFYSKTVFRFS